ncbi:MAG: AAA family ATPase, partial [bacterium]
PARAARRWVRYGASPRGAQALLLAAKARALVHGRAHASVEDVRAVALPALRHRLLLNFEADAEGVEADQVVRDVVEEVPEVAAASAGT